MSASLELSYLLRMTLEALAFLAITCLGLAGRHRAPGGPLAALGGVLASAVALTSLWIFVEVTYLETAVLADQVLRGGEVLSELLAWTRIVGLVLIASAFAVFVRTRTNAPGSA